MRAFLAIDRCHAYALAGHDFLKGKIVFVRVMPMPGEAINEAEERAAFQALDELEIKVGFKLDVAWLPRKK